MHDWSVFAATTSTVHLPAGTTERDATNALYSLPRGVTVSHAHVINTWVQHGDEYVAHVPLHSTVFDVVTNIRVDGDARATLVTTTTGSETECDLLPSLAVLVVAAVFTTFTIKLAAPTDAPVQLTYNGSMYDGLTHHRLAMQSWKTDTHEYHLGTAVQVKK